MPGPLVLIVDTAWKLATGFALGFLARDITAKRVKVKATGHNKSTGSGKGKPKAVAPGVTKTISFKPSEELKMVLCVNEALNMGKGKIGAQCAHAAVGVVQEYRVSHAALFKQWEYGQAKIALKIQDDVEMNQLEAKARSIGLPTYIVHDAGRTQIPAGSQTVLAIGPAPKSVMDTVTGHLRLL